MPRALPFPIRKECPPGACECRHGELLDSWERDDATDIRILQLTREQEKALIASAGRRLPEAGILASGQAAPAKQHRAARHT